MYKVVQLQIGLPSPNMITQTIYKLIFFASLEGDPFGLIFY